MIFLNLHNYKSAPFTRSQKKKTKPTTLAANLPNVSSIPSKIVLTVVRCGGFEGYVGHRVAMNFPKPFEKQKKLSKKSLDQISFTIGAGDDCNFHFENDGYMSSR